MAWHPVIILAFIATLVTAAMAVFVFATAPGAPQNRRLAIVLMLQSAGITGWWMYPVLATPALGFGAGAVNILALLLVPIANIWFLSTLPAPLSRWFGRGTGAYLLGVGVAAICLLAMFAGEAVFGSTVVAWFGGGFSIGVTPLTNTLFQAMGILYLLALLLAYDAFRRAKKGTLARSRAFWFMLAFGLHDLYFFYRIFVLVFFTQIGDAIPPGWVGETIRWGRPISLILLVSLLSYGILRFQVLGIDVRLKFAVKGTTIAAAFGVAFLVVSEVVESILDLPGTWFGIAAAAGIGLLFRPLERVAGRVADKAFPGVDESDAYRDRRAQEIYDAAVAELAGDGFTEREQRMLAALRAKLGMDA